MSVNLCATEGIYSQVNTDQSMKNETIWDSVCLRSDRKSLKDEMLLFLFLSQWWTGYLRGRAEKI